MNAPLPNAALPAAATDEGLDAAHVDRIASRYLAYARHTGSQGRRVQPLAEWFRWYAMENADLINADAAAAPASCSVSTEAVGTPRADRSRAMYTAVAAELQRRGAIEPC